MIVKNVAHFRHCFILLLLINSTILPLSRTVEIGSAEEPSQRLSPQPEDAAQFSREIAPLLQTYCGSCHSGPEGKAGVVLSAFADEQAALQDRPLWKKVLRQLESGAMPPKGKRQPSVAERKLMHHWIETRALKIDCAAGPGQVPIRRLNRLEYDNTVRDLLGIDFHAGREFPVDDEEFAFENVADLYSAAPLLIQKYLPCAEKAARAAIVVPAKGAPTEKASSAASEELPASHRKLITSVPASGDDTAQCARSILRPFALRAFRRPPGDDEVDALVAIVEKVVKSGEPFERGIQAAVESVLVSPQFLFRIEPDPAGSEVPAIRTLTDYELATRLSYFLWSSMPDDELFGLAAEGRLRDAGRLEIQVRRMLADEKSAAFLESFASQWLQLDLLETAAPSTEQFPQFHAELKQAMASETKMFVTAVVREDRSVLDFLNADFTFLNERLARHYGIDGVEGKEFRRVALATEERGGLLGQGSFLTLTSTPTRTSPVKRGKWILENILGAPPAPPPPDIPDLDARARTSPGHVRRRLEQHRRNSACTSCHSQMDELGLGLENYDPVGAWRTSDGVFRVLPAGVLEVGGRFESVAELRQILRSRKTEFYRCLTGKLLAYALGRESEDADVCSIDPIVAQITGESDRFVDFVVAVVKCELFQKRRVVPEQSPGSSGSRIDVFAAFPDALKDRSRSIPPPTTSVSAPSPKDTPRPPDAGDYRLLRKHDLRYVGAFRLPAIFSYGGTALAYCDSHKSLFLVGHDHRQEIAEVAIPPLKSGPSTDDLEFARLLQSPTPVLNRVSLKTLQGVGTVKVGGLLVVGDKLVGSVFAFYDGAGSAKESHFTMSSLDLKESEVSGLFQVGSLGGGFVGGWMAPVPDEWQAGLKAPYLTGVGGLAVISRSSSGPAAFGFDPASLGDSPIPANGLVYYPLKTPLADVSKQNPYYNLATSFGGIAFPGKTRSVLFFGRHGIGPYCYGTGEECNDPVDPSKGTHAYPYIYQIWAYDVDDLVDAANRKKSPWTVRPYDVWQLDLPYEVGNKRIGGVAWNAADRILYVSQLYADHIDMYNQNPVIHAFRIDASR